MKLTLSILKQSSDWNEENFGLIKKNWYIEKLNFNLWNFGNFGKVREKLSFNDILLNLLGFQSFGLARDSGSFFELFGRTFRGVLSRGKAKVKTQNDLFAGSSFL